MYAPSSYNEGLNGESLSCNSEKSDNYSDGHSAGGYSVCKLLIFPKRKKYERCASSFKNIFAKIFAAFIQTFKYISAMLSFYTHYFQHKELIYCISLFPAY